MGYVREKFILTGELWGKIDEMSQRSELSLGAMKEQLGESADNSLSLFVLEEKGYRRAMDELITFLQGVEHDHERKNFEDYMEEELKACLEYEKKDWETEQKAKEDQRKKDRIGSLIKTPSDT